MIQLVVKRAAALVEFYGVDGRPGSPIPLLGLSRGNLRPLRGAGPEAPLPPGHYRVVAWSRGDADGPARLELADLDLRTEFRLTEAGSAQRHADGRLLEIGGIVAPTGGLGGRTGVTIHGEDAAPSGGGIRVPLADLLRLIALLEADPSRGAVVLTVTGEPYLLD